MKTDSVLLDVYVDIDYTIDEPFEQNSPSGKCYPITVQHVRLRGREIEPVLHVGHIMMIQRRLYFKLLDEEFSEE